MRVGVIGTGYAGRKHIEAWLELGVEVQICARPEDDPAATGERYGVPAGSDTTELISSVDVVDVCTPTDSHAPLVVAAAAHGRHVVCEKPIAGSLEEATAMVRSCREAGVQFHVGHLMRYSPPYAAAAAAIAEGRIGRPVVAHLNRLTPPPAHSTWMGDPTRSGGVIVDLMIHDIDYVRWVCGDVTQVVARTVGPQESHAYAILTHDTGAISHLTASWAMPRGAGSQIDFEIAGVAGLVEYSSSKGNPLRIEPPELARGVDPSPWGEHPVTTELREFCTALAGGAAPRVSAEDGLAALRIALAATESARSGRAVNPQEL